MPLYTFELSTTLEASQMEKLAQEITEWHAQAFTIPRMAISCQFQDVSGNYGFAGGKRQTYNRLYIHQRTATQSVPAEQLEAHAQNVLRLWDEIISGACMSSPAERAASPKALHGVYIVSSISLAYEYGVFLPMVSENCRPEWFYPLTVDASRLGRTRTGWSRTRA